MDRIRAGLTGLGVVFLITAVASLLFSPSPAERARVEQVKEPGEPLSQLGVAPNSEKESEQVPAPAVAPAVPPADDAQAPLAESPVNGEAGALEPGAYAAGSKPVEI